jgi:hypothetical protein
LQVKEKLLSSINSTSPKAKINIISIHPAKAKRIRRNLQPNHDSHQEKIVLMTRALSEYITGSELPPCAVLLIQINHFL